MGKKKEKLFPDKGVYERQRLRAYSFFGAGTAGQGRAAAGKEGGQVGREGTTLLPLSAGRVSPELTVI